MTVSEQYRALLERIRPHYYVAKARVHKFSVAGVQSHIDRADARAMQLAPTLQEIRNEGVTRPYGIAKALNARGSRTSNGNLWTWNTVTALLARLDGKAAE